MKIAVVASEGAPYAKSGGLGDVMEALPAALSRIEGNEVALFLPYYKKIKDAAEKYPVESVATFKVTLGWRQQAGPPAAFVWGLSGGRSCQRPIFLGKRSHLELEASAVEPEQ